MSHHLASVSIIWELKDHPCTELNYSCWNASQQTCPIQINFYLFSWAIKYCDYYLSFYKKGFKLSCHCIVDTLQRDNSQHRYGIITKYVWNDLCFTMMLYFPVLFYCSVLLWLFLNPACTEKETDVSFQFQLLSALSLTVLLCNAGVLWVVLS